MKKTEQHLPAGEFKAKCLQLMDAVQKQHFQIVITKRGKPVAKLVPYETTPPSLFGFMKGSATIHGDIISPIDVQWDAND